MSKKVLVIYVSENVYLGEEKKQERCLTLKNNQGWEPESIGLPSNEKGSVAQGEFKETIKVIIRDWFRELKNIEDYKIEFNTKFSINGRIHIKTTKTIYGTVIETEVSMNHKLMIFEIMNSFE